MESTRTETGVTCPNLIITISPSSEGERKETERRERKEKERRETKREEKRERERERRREK